ncbi:hypothetical protein QL285_096109 [Trifolium repens]|nr:hypothetical protein QL285_096109 [Trifolium repens]
MQTQNTPFTAEVSSTNEHRIHLICCGARKVNCWTNLSLFLVGILILRAKVLLLLVKLMHGDHEDSMLDGIKTEKKCTSE